MADYFTFKWGFWKSKQKFLMVKLQILMSVGGNIFREESFFTPLHKLQPVARKEKRINSVIGLIHASVWASVLGPWAAQYHLVLSELVRSAFLLTFYKRGTDRGTDWWSDLPKEVTVEAHLQIRTPRCQTFTFTTRPAFHSYFILSFYPYFFLVNTQYLALKNSIHVL